MSGQWLDKKKQYGYVTKKIKKYVCVQTKGKQPGMEDNQVQPMVSDNVCGGIRTTIFIENENNVTVMRKSDVPCTREGNEGSTQFGIESFCAGTE